MNVFNFILRQNTFFLFFLALALSIALRGVFLLEDQYLSNYKYLFMALILFVGVFNALVMIIVFVRIVQFIFSVIFKIIDTIERKPSPPSLNLDTSKNTLNDRFSLSSVTEENFPPQRPYEITFHSLWSGSKMR